MSREDHFSYSDFALSVEFRPSLTLPAPAGYHAG
jgi:hypothetical protein